MTLAQTAVYSWRLGRWADALTAAERSVEIIRRLVAAGPVAPVTDLTRSMVVEEFDLATGLANLGFFLWGARRRDEALAALHEAAAIRPERARRRSAWSPHCGRTLAVARRPGSCSSGR